MVPQIRLIRSEGPVDEGETLLSNESASVVESARQEIHKVRRELKKVGTHSQELQRDSETTKKLLLSELSEARSEMVSLRERLSQVRASRKFVSCASHDECYVSWKEHKSPRWTSCWP